MHTNLTLSECLLTLLPTCILFVVLLCFRNRCIPSQYYDIKQKLMNVTTCVLGVIILKKKKKHLSPFLATRPFKQYIPPNYNFPRYLLLERKWLKPSWHPKVAFFSWRKTCNFSDDFEGEIWG